MTVITILYGLAAGVLVGWSFLHIVTHRDGLVGKVLHFLLCCDAASVLFPYNKVYDARVMVILLASIVIYHGFFHKHAIDR